MKPNNTSKDIPIPPWLKNKCRDPQIERKGSPMIAIGVISSAIAAYVAMNLAKPAGNESNGNANRSRTAAAQVAYSKSHTNSNQIPLATLTEHELGEMLPQLKSVYSYMQSGRSEGRLQQKCKKTAAAGDLQSMVNPSRYLTTQCMADASYELYSSTEDPRYLQLAHYYYRRCLYLIEGQLRGEFRKPRGGNPVIKERQEKVFAALEKISSYR